MKNSIAIWTENPPAASDLHINYWILKRAPLFRDHFLDFGLKLLDCDGGSVNIYIPIKFKENNLLEIGSELCRRDLANALFNENCEIISNEGKRFDIKLPKERLTVFIFDKENDVRIEQRYDGTLFTISIPKEKKNWYIRFRIKNTHSDIVSNLLKPHTLKTIRTSFSQKHTPGGSFYQSVRSSVEAVDFRVNNKRDLNLSLLDEYQNKFIRLRKLHFFLIYDNDEEFIFSSIKPTKVRLLENKIWRNYLKGLSGADRKYCATHWSCSPLSDEGWEIFIKIKYASANILTITWYMILIILIAIAVNVFSAFLYDKLNDSGFFDGPTQVEDGNIKK
ncbi:MAG: hypothetical protein PVG39_09755 [Desulfobacteraceae bacterium]|jgi:hypothetical protein